jgi:hypothetical protein
VPTPGSLSGSDGDYLLEQDTLVLGELRGYADVFYRNHFAWENKAPGRNLDSALKQLLTYSLALSNPPLLVVYDRLTLRIHTQFNGHPSEVHTVLLHEMDQPDKQSLLRRLWLDPESFNPKKTSRDITEAAAKSFSTLAEGLRKRGPARAGQRPGPHEPRVPKSAPTSAPARAGPSGVRRRSGALPHPVPAVYPNCEWVNDGAAVRVALICVSAKKVEAVQHVDGQVVPAIYADLGHGSATFDADFTKTVSLDESSFCAFTGSSKKGQFEVPGSDFREWLKQPNPNDLSNAGVLRKFSNGRDITDRDRDYWVVGFGPNMEMHDAAPYVGPFEYVKRVVKPARDIVRNPAEKRLWWLHARTMRGLRSEISRVSRFIFTTLTAKHRLFSWRASHYLPDNSVVVIARADDTTFGILHSRFHELWSLRMGTSLEDRPRYTPTTCFETFPFPAGLTPLDTAHQRTELLESGVVIPADLSADNAESNVPLARGICASSY